VRKTRIVFCRLNQSNQKYSGTILLDVGSGETELTRGFISRSKESSTVKAVNTLVVRALLLVLLGLSFSIVKVMDVGIHECLPTSEKKSDFRV
jgi:hypothetical protein